MTGNLDFTPQPIEAVGFRGEGPHVRAAMAIVQRTTPLRAYNAFASGRDWMEKLSSAYVVALATRSADTCLMKRIQSSIVENPRIACARCRDATIGINIIRARNFPTLALLRAHANTLIHHLDSPQNRGIAELNVQGVFDYCYHLFQNNAQVLFGDITEAINEARFEFKKCSQCRRADASTA
jgi:hypothetical protein